GIVVASLIVASVIPAAAPPAPVVVVLLLALRAAAPIPPELRLRRQQQREADARGRGDHISSKQPAELMIKLPIAAALLSTAPSRTMRRKPQPANNTAKMAT